MKGTIVNTAAILVGSGIGLILKNGISSKYQQTVMQGLSFAVGIVGIQMALKTQNILAVIVSLVIGGIVGEWLGIQSKLDGLGNQIEKHFKGTYGKISEGFITASLVYCIGAMAIVGSIQDGISGDASTLYAKSMLDGISAVIFTAGMGIGVALSSIPVLLYQGTITILAQYFSTLLSSDVIREMTAVGGILIVGISIILLEIKTIKIANLLPSILIIILIVKVWP